jgi:hypothetical protein
MYVLPSASVLQQEAVSRHFDRQTNHKYEQRFRLRSENSSTNPNHNISFFKNNIVSFVSRNIISRNIDLNPPFSVFQFRKRSLSMMRFPINRPAKITSFRRTKIGRISLE